MSSLIFSDFGTDQLRLGQTLQALEDASNVILDFKSREPGLARVAEVVAADISSQAGSSSTLLSFQRGLVPLVLASLLPLQSTPKK